VSGLPDEHSMTHRATPVNHVGKPPNCMAAIRGFSAYDGPFSNIRSSELYGARPLGSDPEQYPSNKKPQLPHRGQCPDFRNRESALDSMTLTDQVSFVRSSIKRFTAPDYYGSHGLLSDDIMSIVISALSNS